MSKESNLFKNDTEDNRSLFEKVSDYLVSINPECKEFMLTTGTGAYLQLLSGNTKTLYEYTGKPIPIAVSIARPFQSAWLIRNDIIYYIFSSYIFDSNDIICTQLRGVNSIYIKINFEFNTIEREY